MVRAGPAGAVDHGSQSLVDRIANELGVVAIDAAWRQPPIAGRQPGSTVLAMMPIAQRATRRTIHALLGEDTFAVLAARCEELVSSGRRMTLIERYEERTGFPKVSTGLYPDNNPDAFYPPIHVANNPELKLFEVRLRPGIEMFGFAWHPGDGLEADATARMKNPNKRGRDHGREAIALTIVGGNGNGIGRDDRIEMRRQNSFGVVVQQVIAFDYVEAEQEAEQEALLVDDLAAHADEHGPLDAGALCTIAHKVRHTWKPVSHVLHGKQ